MAKPERLPSGLWSMRIRLPDGSRPRVTHELKSVVVKLAGEAQAEADRGEWIDPRMSATKVRELWPRAERAWDGAAATLARYASTWATHVEPKWANWSVGEIYKPDITEWVKAMKDAGTGPTTIEHAVTLLRKLLELAVDLRMLRSNPAAGVGTPARNIVPDRTLTLSAEAAILASAELHFPDRLDAAPFIEGLMDSGGRWQDAAGLIKRNIDRMTGMAHLTGVLERTGQRRSTLKTDGQEVTGGRHVMLMETTLDRIAGRLDAIGLDDLVYVSPNGRPLNYHNWRGRVWDPTVERARLCGGELKDCDVRPAPHSKYHRPGPAYCQVAEHGLGNPLPTPHITRHTFGTRLAEDGTPIHEIQALMGHKNRRSTERYIHAGETRFERARMMRKRSAS